MVILWLINYPLVPTPSLPNKRVSRPTLRRGNALAAGARLTVDLQLDVGQVTERVVVEAVGDTVNTTSGEYFDDHHAGPSAGHGLKPAPL